MSGFVPEKPTNPQWVDRGCLVEYLGERFEVTHVLSKRFVLGRQVTTGKIDQLPTLDLRVLPENSQSTKDSTEPRNSISAGCDLRGLDDGAWEIAQKRLEIIRPLLDNPVRTRKYVEAYAKEHGVSATTIYDWIERFETEGSVSGLIPQRRGPKEGSVRLRPEVESIIDEAIRSFYLKSQKLTPIDVIEEVAIRCKALQLPVPHANTVRNRIAALPPKEVLVARGEREQAKNKYRPAAGSFPGADEPFAVVQIDHTPADIILVDEHTRKPFSRPYITLAIDVFSRMPAGVYVSFDEPSAVAVGMVLAQIMCPKDAPLAKLGVAGAWPVHGCPAMVHLDNAAEFKSKALVRAAEEYGINLQWRPKHTPETGGHIERLIGTTLKKIHKLPGSTFSNPKHRGEYDSERHAALTLREFEIELVDWLVNTYAQKYHAGIQGAPIRRWRQGIAAMHDMGRVLQAPKGRTPERVLLDFLPFAYRTIQRYGIMWDNFTYYDRAIDRYVNALDPDDPKRKRQFLVCRDPRDISFVYVYDAEDRAYLKIGLAAAGRPPISEWEARRAQKALVAAGRADINETLIYEQVLRSRQRVDEAVVATKAALREKARRPQHDASAKQKRTSGSASAAPASKPPAPTAGLKPSLNIHPAPAQPADDDVFATPVEPFAYRINQQ